MGINIVDRRSNPKGKSSENRQRLLKRIHGQIKGAIPEIIKNTNIKDINSTKDKINVPVKGIDEPQFTYDKDSGDKKYIHPGNKEYSKGDRIKKEKKSGKGKGSGAGGASDDLTVTEDGFTISIDRNEFLDYFFDDLQLPDMIKKHLSTTNDFKQKKAGYVSYGNPSRLNVVKSYKNSMSRRLSFSIFFDKKIKDLEDKLLLEKDDDKIKLIEDEIERLKKMKKSISFMEEIDLSYNNYEIFPVPILSAVMICIMDVSGSMTESLKDIGKRFFMLLYLFLTKQYQKIDIVFIRHHTAAREVSEDEFFNSRESGGTIVSPALELADKIISTRYSSEYNIYLTQISDGDVWDNSDAIESRKHLEKLLSKIQYAWYVEVTYDKSRSSGLMQSYKKIEKDNFKYGIISNLSEIWPVFEDFFSKKNKTNEKVRY